MGVSAGCKFFIKHTNIVLVAMAILLYLCSYLAMEDTSSVECRYAGDSSSC